MASVRSASNDDARLLTDLIRQAYSGVASRFGLTETNCPSHPAFTCLAEQERAISKGIHYFVLEDGSPVGCVALDSRNREEPWLARLSVLPGKRKRGYGRRLVDHVLQQAREQALDRILIGVIASNHELIDWYDRIGFQRMEVKQHQHLPFEVLLMEFVPRAEQSL